MKHKKWTAHEIDTLVSMIHSGLFTNREIAKRIGRTASGVQLKGKYLGLTNPCYRIRITKHKHLRGPVFRYFLTHTWEETLAKFNLTERSLKSIFNVGYRDPKFAHLRKDTRTKRPWDGTDWLYMIRRAGVRPRSFIGKKLNRGGARVIKERLKTCNSGTKFLNGMPIRWVRTLWPHLKIEGIKTDAGPAGGSGPGNYFFIIVPWIEAYEISLVNRTPVKVKQCIRVMAKFQRWIHGVNSVRGINKKLWGILHER